jgi:hypothetical protein
MALRGELIRAAAERYGTGNRTDKIRILDEFVALTGFHRKHAMRVLRGGPAHRCCDPAPVRGGGCTMRRYARR